MTVKELQALAIDALARELTADVPNDSRAHIALQVLNLPVPYEPASEPEVAGSY